MTIAKQVFMKHDKILLDHGGGGLLTHELIAAHFLPLFSNPLLNRLEDSAVLTIGEQKICFTTDSYVVSPLFFPGGDIGSLAIHGTINDLAVCGGKPLYMSLGFIIEEGFRMNELEKIVHSIAAASEKAGVQIVTGDTKVVPHGSGDGIFINTSGIGVINHAGNLSVKSIVPGDAIIVSGTIGEHGAAILSARESLGLESPILSDSAPLNGMIQEILDSVPSVHCMRDATRGGLGAIVAEIASSAGLDFLVNEIDIPVRDEVRGVCEILGFDPLFLANEGKIVLFCPESEAQKVLEVMKGHKYGRYAAAIGKVNAGGRGRVVMRTAIGGERVLDLPSGELVPRIC